MLFLWTAPPGCAGSVTTSGSWLTLGTPGVSGIYNYLPVTVTQNTGQYDQGGEIDFTGTNFTRAFPVDQGTTFGWEGNVVSITPSNGSGTSQVFTIVASTAGLDETAVQVQFLGADNSSCDVRLFPGGDGTAPYAMLVLDSGAWSGSLPLPSVVNLQNSMCTVIGSQSTVSGPGELMTFQLAISFAQAFAGSRYLSAAAAGTAGLFVEYQTYAAWVVPVDPNQPALRVASSHSGNFTQGEPNTYTLTVSNYPGAAASAGTVTVTDTAPSNTTIASMSGDGWNCSGGTCTAATLCPAATVIRPLP